MAKQRSVEPIYEVAEILDARYRQRRIASLAVIVTNILLVADTVFSLSFIFSFPFLF